jgi:flagellar protein FliS
MNAPTQQEYLRNVVMSAPPERLHLMLYDGAIRFCRQARDAIGRKDIEDSYNLLTRAQNIVLEMQNALRPDVAPELCEQMAALYGFIYRRLVEANVNKDVEAVGDALRILEYQRETWVMLLEKLSAEGNPSDNSSRPVRKPPAEASTELDEHHPKGFTAEG